jgi:subtilisin family serine protease
MRLRLIVVAALAAVCGSAFAGPWKSAEARAQDKEVKAWLLKNPNAQVVPDRYFVRFSPNVNEAARTHAVKGAGGMRLKGFNVLPDVELVQVKLPAGKAQELLLRHPNVVSVTPEPVAHISATPNDTDFGLLWGMHQASDIDIDAPEAWDAFTGDPNFVIAIFDTGINYGHPDLAANVWTNPGEIAANGIDDEGNGYIDDIHGYDFVNDDADPADDHSHGSHCAGTIGGAGNNSQGVAGVNWQIKMAAIKAFNSSGSGAGADILEGVDYIAANNFALSSHSWRGTGAWPELYTAIQALGEAGHLLVAAAGNDNVNLDTFAEYPGGFDLDCIISVAAVTSAGARASFSNYGAVHVDLGAPGVGIYSTVLGTGYASYNGTSMACPHVAGAAAWLWAQRPGWTAAQVKARILGRVTPMASMSGITVTGGFLNLAALDDNALADVTITGPDDGASVHGESGFSATAIDDEDGDISANISWSSDVDGDLGTGASILAELSLGAHVITATVTDADGEESSASINVYSGNQAPTVNAGSDQVVYITGALTSVSLLGTASDPDGDDFDVAWTEGVTALGTTLDLLLNATPGIHTYTLEATDSLGTSNSDSVEVWLQYQWSGFLKPLSGQAFRVGKSVPVAFQLTGASAAIRNLSATLEVAQVVGGTPGTYSNVGSFSWTKKGNQYTSSWGTSGWAKGTYRLRAVFGDGVERTVDVVLK